MKFNILNVSGGTFTDDQGKNIAYGSVHCLDDEVISIDGFSGQTVKKIRCDPELIHRIGSLVPGYFDCDIDIVGKDSKVKIVSAQLVDKKSKAV